MPFGLAQAPLTEHIPHMVRSQRLLRRLAVSDWNAGRVAIRTFARRKIDPLERRSVLVAHTRDGQAFLRELKRLARTAADEAPSDVAE